MSELSSDPNERREQLRTDRTIGAPESQYELSSEQGHIRCRVCRPAFEVSLAHGSLERALRLHNDGSAHQAALRAWQSNRTMDRCFVTATVVRQHRNPVRPAPTKRKCLGLYDVPGTSPLALQELQRMPPGETWFGVPHRRVLLPGGSTVAGSFESHACLEETASTDATCSVCRSIADDRLFKSRLGRIEDRIRAARGGGGDGDGDAGGGGGGDAGAGGGGGGDGQAATAEGTDDDGGAGAVAHREVVPPPHSQTNFRYVSHDHLLTVAHRQQQDCRRLRWEKFLCCAKLSATQARARTWRERARSAAGRGELRTVTDELSLAYQRGHFKGKRVLWHFLSDLIHAVAAEPDKNGRRRKLHWHEGTHRLFGMLRKIGGPRTQRFFVQNLGGPDESTTRKRWNKKRFLYQPGLHDATFAHLEARYTEARAALAYKGKVICEAAEDETNILAEIRYNAKRDAVTGT